MVTDTRDRGSNYWKDIRLSFIIKKKKKIKKPLRFFRIMKIKYKQ